MELKILEKSARRLLFQIPGADHTFCNVLKKELIDIDGVDLATYAVEHPQIGIPKMLIETKTGVKPKDVLEQALDEIKKKNKNFLKHFKTAIK